MPSRSHVRRGHKLHDRELGSTLEVRVECPEDGLQVCLWLRKPGQGCELEDAKGGAAEDWTLVQERERAVSFGSEMAWQGSCVRLERLGRGWLDGCR